MKINELVLDAFRWGDGNAAAVVLSRCLGQDVDDTGISVGDRAHDIVFAPACVGPGAASLCLCHFDVGQWAQRQDAAHLMP